MDLEQGVRIDVRDTASHPHTILVREGCSGSPLCAVELYIATGLGSPFDGINLHLSDDEARALRRALKAAHRRRAAA